jgi:hypothetical protein
MVPKMIKYYINVETSNMIDNYIKDSSYFVTPNSFYLNAIRIGPFATSKNLDVKVEDFLRTNFKGKIKDNSRIEQVKTEEEAVVYFYVVEFSNKLPIKSDLKVSVKGFGFKFYFWCNLWYTALDLIKIFIDQVQMECFLNRVPSHSVHPKLRITSTMYHKKNKFNYGTKKENPEVELSDIRSKINLKEGLIEEEDEGVKHGMNKSSSSANIPVDVPNLLKEKPLSKFAESTPKARDSLTMQIEKIYDIIDSLNNDTDLNILIDTINNIRAKDNKPIFHKDNLRIQFGSDEVDKFFEAKKMHKDFNVELCFELIEKDKF